MDIIRVRKIDYGYAHWLIRCQLCALVLQLTLPVANHQDGDCKDTQLSSRLQN